MVSSRVFHGLSMGRRRVRPFLLTDAESHPAVTREQPLQRHVPVNAFLDDLHAALPEGGLFEVYAKACRELVSAALAGASQQCIVLLQEVVTPLPVNDIQAQAEEQTEGIGLAIPGRGGRRQWPV